MANRTAVEFLLNGKWIQVSGPEAHLNVAEFLRQRQALVGTKIVCSEGDCGACTVLLSRQGEGPYQPVNSCILPVYQLEGCALITVEGLSLEGPHPLQLALLEHQGTQCGFCTPGIVTALVGRAETCQSLCFSEQNVKNALTGNLCRCTGYEPILKAGQSVNLTKLKKLGELFPISSEDRQRLQDHPKHSLNLVSEKRQVFMPGTLPEAYAFKKENPQAKVVAGATDLGVQVNKGKIQLERILSLQKLGDLRAIQGTPGSLELGANVTWSELEKALPETLAEFRRLIHIFASPQIKNLGTVVGNIVNGSPIADSLPFFFLTEARVRIGSLQGEREISILDLYRGYKKLALEEKELVLGLRIPIFSPEWNWKLYKVSARRDLDISAVTFAGAVKVAGRKIQESRWALGGVGPLVLRLKDLEKELIGKDFTAETFQWAGQRALTLITPIHDVRGSLEFRRQLVRNLMQKFYLQCQPEQLGQPQDYPS